MKNNNKQSLFGFGVILPGFAISVLVALIAWGLSFFIPKLGDSTIAILLGILLGNTIITHPRFNVGTKFSESRLLEYSVVLLGFTVTFQTIAEMGLNGLLFVVLMMTTVILSTIYIGKKLKFSTTMSMMMAGGNGVCGSSAIGAIAPAIGADEEEKGQAITLVNLMGTVMMLGLPIIATSIFPGHFLSQSAMLGGSLQSVGQVVAGASLIGPKIVNYAMLFKITRIIFLVVVVWAFQRGLKATGQAPAETNNHKHVSIPWYVLLFLLLCIINSSFHLPAIFGDGAHFISHWCETIALAAIGIRLNFKRFMQEGTRFLTYGVLIGSVQIVAALTYITLLHIK